jgi:hypothetical protein
VIEVGCGTGSLTFTLPQRAALGRISRRHSTKRPPRRATARWGVRSTRPVRWRECGLRPGLSKSTSDR